MVERSRRRKPRTISKLEENQIESAKKVPERNLIGLKIEIWKGKIPETTRDGRETSWK